MGSRDGRVEEALRDEFAAWIQHHPNAGHFDWRVAAQNVSAAFPSGVDRMDAEINKAMREATRQLAVAKAEREELLVRLSGVGGEAREVRAAAERLVTAVAVKGISELHVETVALRAALDSGTGNEAREGEQ